MARKYLILFAVLSLCFFNLISSFLGEKGYFANKQLQRQLIENEYQMDREEVELENLKIREEELSTEDGIRFAAINLGYQVDSDEVYVFQEEDVFEMRHSQPKDSVNEGDKEFKPWKLGFILIVTLCSSATLTLLVWLMKGPEENEDPSDDSDESPSEEE